MFQNNILSNIRRFLPAPALSFKLALLFSILLLVTSCEESSFVGLEVQPQADRFRVKSYVDEVIGSSVWKRDSIMAIDHPRSLLGVNDDPLFGRLNASFLTQVGILANVDFGDERVADSLVLYLVYTSSYGGEQGPQEVSVYEITEDIDHEENYFSNLDPWTVADQSDVLATRTINPAEGDTLISIPITSQRLIEKLLFAPDTVTQSLGNFITYFKGIYVTANLEGENASIYSVNLNHPHSKLSLYYRNDTPDTSFRYDFIINEGANRINLFEQDYSAAVFNDIIGIPESDDSLYYVQGASGVMARLDFNYLHTWRDSMPVSINSARLYMPVDLTVSDTDKYPLPGRIALFERDSEGELIGVIDISLGDEYFGGTFNTERGYYSVNITNWVQAFVRGKKTSPSLYVSLREPATTPNRIVFRNGNHSLGGTRLEITYTKH